MRFCCIASDVAKLRLSCGLPLARQSNQWIDNAGVVFGARPKYVAQELCESPKTLQVAGDGLVEKVSSFPIHASNLNITLFFASYTEIQCFLFSHLVLFLELLKRLLAAVLEYPFPTAKAIRDFFFSLASILSFLHFKVNGEPQKTAAASPSKSHYT